jgi:hypothetical protein
VINLNEEPTLVNKMIEYFYTLDYQVDTYITPSDGCINTNYSGLQENEDNPPFQPEGRTSQSNLDGATDLPEESASVFDPLSFHILMYSLADRLFIHGLKALSKQNVERELVRRLDANSFPQAIIEIYNSTPESDRGLRDLVVKITMDHLTALRSSEGSKAAAFQNNLLKSVPQFSYDLLVAIMNKSVSIWNGDDFIWKNWLWKGWTL